MTTFRRILPWALLFFTAGVHGQFKVLETEHLRLLYYGELQSHLVSHVARTFENALRSHMELFDYAPSQKITILLHDFKDTGNAAAGAIPRNTILMAVAPFRYAFETLPMNERMNWLMHHELVHILVSDKANRTDRLYRALFGGKVNPSAENPLSFAFAYLTTPRAFAPTWYHEGIAVFLETWRTGGLGRIFSGYDEMMFRARVLENEPLLDRLSLESAGGRIDFQVGVNAYLYGARFFAYLALQYGPDSLIRWVSRTDGSHFYFATRFQQVYGRPLDVIWQEWIEWEKEFQQANLTRLRANPLTAWKPVSSRTAGSVSRPYFDPAAGEVYLAVNYPGQVAHIAALNLESGRLRKLADVRGAALYEVTSLAYDAAGGQLFFTDNNNDLRSVYSLEIQTGRVQRLLHDARIGYLAFNRADRSIWGMRHDNGFSTLVRIPHPYREWNQVYTWPYGKDFYDLDISPDGKRLSGALTEISGRQSLAVFETEALLRGDTACRTVPDFDFSSPANFVFSEDGKYLYGSSYYSGVSNLYRCELATLNVEPVTNADTGFFRPLPLGEDSLLAFRYTPAGFQPVRLAAAPVPKVSAIRFLGQEIVDKHPVVKDWKAGSPSDIDLDALTVRKGEYRWPRHFSLAYAYPLVEGYKDSTAYGVHATFSDSLNLYNLGLTASCSPDGRLAPSERIHLNAEFRWWNWKVQTAYNYANFYDLFGPTKVSRKGFKAGIQYQRFLIYDEPNRFCDYTLYAEGYTGLDRLPDYQQVQAGFSRMLRFGAKLDYRTFMRSLGAVEDEKGYQLQAVSRNMLVDGKLYPQLFTTGAYGFQLPLPHSSIWLRGAAGKGFGDRANPAANFYFGGFGNNWVDHLNEKRYQEYYSFPGLDLNEAPGHDFAKATVEWSLPQLVFRRLGWPAAYCAWLKPAIFGSTLVTNLADAPSRRKLANAGAQVDVRLMVLSHYQFTLSAGYAVAFESGHSPRGEYLVSLKIQ